MDKSTETHTIQRSLAKGLLAGLIGGLVATAAKTLAEKFYPPRTHGEPEPPHALAQKISEGAMHHHLSPGEESAAAETIHWGFGAAVGAAYGVIAEFYPLATAKEGATFGVALCSLTHESALPALGLSAPTEEQTTREHSSEMTTHVIYGVVTEFVRKNVRKLL